MLLLVAYGQYKTVLPTQEHPRSRPFTLNPILHFFFVVDYFFRDSFSFQNKDKQIFKRNPLREAYFPRLAEFHRFMRIQVRGVLLTWAI